MIFQIKCSPLLAVKKKINLIEIESRKKLVFFLCFFLQIPQHCYLYNQDATFKDDTKKMRTYQSTMYPVVSYILMLLVLIWLLGVGKKGAVL